LAVAPDGVASCGTRVAWTARLRPDQADAHVEAHGKVWPNVLHAIRAAGIRDHSDWLCGDRVCSPYFPLE